MATPEERLISQRDRYRVVIRHIDGLLRRLRSGRQVSPGEVARVKAAAARARALAG